MIVTKLKRIAANPMPSIHPEEPIEKSMGEVD
jgi:hypothetical protein